MTEDPTRLPPGLPLPVDDGAADHLPGTALPDVTLEIATGGKAPLTDLARGILVLYAYPRTGGSEVDLPDDWDLIPGARGCTPQSCAFRDHEADLAALSARVVGVSAQPIGEQRAFAARMHIPFPLLNDSDLRLSAPPLSLPTFTAGGFTLYKRLTLVARAGLVEHVLYPVFPPDQNAEQVIGYLRGSK